MKIDKIYKFGGTSLASAERLKQAVKHVKREQSSLLIVVSALGKTTDSLLKAGTEAEQGRNWSSILGKLAYDTLCITDELELDFEVIAPLFKEVEEVLFKIQATEKSSAEDIDHLISYGERISARVFAELLRLKGIPAKAYDSWELGLITDQRFRRAAPLNESYELINKRVSALKENIIPVVTGFIGKSKDGRVTTLGRDGSDYTATIFANALNVNEVRIYTDVPGIYRVDPALIETCDTIANLSIEEASILAYYGTKILHPRTIEPLINCTVPVRILKSFNGNSTHINPSGTLIQNRQGTGKIEALILIPELEALHIDLPLNDQKLEVLGKVFSLVAEMQSLINVTTTENSGILISQDRNGPPLNEIKEKLEKVARVKSIKDFTVLALVGSGISNNLSILGHILEILQNEDVAVLGIMSHGNYEIRLSIQCERSKSINVLRAIHAKFFEEKEVMIMN